MATEPTSPRHPWLTAFALSVLTAVGASVTTWVFAAGELAADVRAIKDEQDRRRPLMDSVIVMQSDLQHIKQRTEALDTINNSLVRLTVQMEAINHRLARQDP